MCKHRAVCPEWTATSGIGAVRQSAAASGQRGAKRQPTGQDPGAGTVPEMTGRLVPGSMLAGIECSNACEYGMAGARTRSASGADSTT